MRLFRTHQATDLRFDHRQPLARVFLSPHKTTPRDGLPCLVFQFKRRAQAAMA
jgi:hypothetical protein